MSRVLLCLLIASLLPGHVTSGKVACEWVGSSPLCLSKDCSPGYTEILRSGYAFTFFTEFGKICARGEKKLCCRPEAIRLDLEKHCEVNHEDKGCPSTRPRLISAINKDTELEMMYTCCDGGTLVGWMENNETEQVKDF